MPDHVGHFAYVRAESLREEDAERVMHREDERAGDERRRKVVTNAPICSAIFRSICTHPVVRRFPPVAERVHTSVDLDLDREQPVFLLSRGHERDVPVLVYDIHARRPAHTVRVSPSSLELDTATVVLASDQVHEIRELKRGHIGEFLKRTGDSH